jgi:hypothetical protein
MGFYFYENTQNEIFKSLFIKNSPYNENITVPNLLHKYQTLLSEAEA